MTAPAKKPQTTFDPNRNDFRRKLGYYLTGLAIGLFILGAIQVLKRTMAPPGGGQSQGAGQSQGGSPQMAK